MLSTQRASGPVDVIDLAFSAVRSAKGKVLEPSLAGGAILAGWLVALFYVERVEGIRGARLLFALGFVLAWWARALLHAKAARVAVTVLAPDLPLDPEAGRPIAVLRSASIVASTTLVWGLVFGLAALASVFGMLGVAPLVVLRGAVAPGWIAGAACRNPAGLRGYWLSVRDASGRRGLFVVLEGLMLVALFAVALNLSAVTATVVLVLRSFLGLDVAFVDSFLSPANMFVVLGVMTAAWWMLEPLRVALAAVAFVEARVREDALDLRGAVDRAIAHADQRRTGAQGRSNLAATVVMCFAIGGALGVTAAVAHAQPTTHDAPDVVVSPAPAGPAVGESRDHSSEALEHRDGRTRALAERILAQPEFREFSEPDRAKGLRDLVDRLLRWLFERSKRDENAAPTGLRLPAVPGFVLAAAFGLFGALLVAYFAWLAFTSRQERRRTSAARLGLAAPADLREQPPEQFLDEAAVLASRGEHRLALRALYLATLVSLDRRGLIAFEPTRTNWQYLRRLPHGPVRIDFARFTRIFDHKWYGQEVVTEQDYVACRSLADAICRPEAA